MIIKKNSSNGLIVTLDILIFIIFAMFFTASLFANIKEYYPKEFLFLLTYLTIFAYILKFAVLGIRKNFLILAFLTCFFCFLMGQKLVYYFVDGSINTFRTFVLLELNDLEYLKFISLIYMSIISVSTSYQFKQVKVKKTISSSEMASKKRFIIMVCLVVTFVGYALMQVLIIKQKADMSYTETYLTNYDIPVLIKILAYLFYGMFFIFLASKPSKKTMLIVCALFLVADGALNLFTGRRAALGKDFLIILFYIIIYDKTVNEGAKIITPKRMLLVGGALVGLVVIFVMIEIVRENKSQEFSSLTQIFDYFFRTIGGSDSVIGNTIRHQNEFEYSGWRYLFNPIMEAITENPIVKAVYDIFGIKRESYAQGYDYIQNHINFSHWISYIVNEELYLTGHGMGSSYIAELYLAGGFFGVIIGNLLLGMIIKMLSNIKLSADRVMRNAIALSITFSLFLLPRSGVFDTISDLVYVIIDIIIIKVLFILFVNTKVSKNGTKTIEV